MDPFGRPPRDTQLKDAHRPFRPPDQGARALHIPTTACAASSPKARHGRRDFIRSAFAAALAGAAASAASAQTNPVPAEGGDPNILNLPAHSTGLGQGVASDGYGKPSKYEANVQRRQSPGLTQTTQSSVSFAPLQSLFGIITPSGLHFERHHQGWWDIDPSKHRLMVNGSRSW